MGQIGYELTRLIELFLQLAHCTAKPFLGHGFLIQIEVCFRLQHERCHVSTHIFPGTGFGNALECLFVVGEDYIVQNRIKARYSGR